MYTTMSPFVVFDPTSYLDLAYRIPVMIISQSRTILKNGPRAGYPNMVPLQIRPDYIANLEIEKVLKAVREGAKAVEAGIQDAECGHIGNGRREESELVRID